MERVERVAQNEANKRSSIGIKGWRKVHTHGHNRDILNDEWTMGMQMDIMVGDD